MPSPSQQLPLFPLPNVVHFPSTDLRLHIFEPRYRQLIEDLRGRPERDRLIGMVLLKPGWEYARDDSPEVYLPGTAGLLVEHEYLEDGRSNIVLRGQYRFQIDREFPSHPYRQAIVLPFGSSRLNEGVPETIELRREIDALLASLEQRIGRGVPLGLDSEQAADSTLAEVVNTVAARLDLPPENKLDLLTRELPDRAQRVLSILKSRERVLDLLDPYRGASSLPDLN
jgi:Lon protease-like protein